jgi:hypothetical protein
MEINYGFTNKKGNEGSNLGFLPYSQYASFVVSRIFDRHLNLVKNGD